MRARALLLLPALALALAACSDSSGDGGPSPARETKGEPAAAKHVIATLGDSIVAGSPRWDPDPEVRADFDEPTRKSQWQYWVDVPADTELRNCGVWGERTDEISQRFEACTKGAEAIIIQGGINDIVQDRPVADAVDDLTCMAELARKAGLDIAIADVLPWNNGFPGAAPDIREINAAIAALAKQGGVPLLPFYATLDDPDNPGRMPEDLTDDGNHPTPEGYRLLGERAWRAPEGAKRPFTDAC